MANNIFKDTTVVCQILPQQTEQSSVPVQFCLGQHVEV